MICSWLQRIHGRIRNQSQTFSVPTQHLVWETSSLPMLLSYYSDVDSLNNRDPIETSHDAKHNVISTRDNRTQAMEYM